MKHQLKDNLGETLCRKCVNFSSNLDSEVEIHRQSDTCRQTFSNSGRNETRKAGKQSSCCLFLNRNSLFFPDSESWTLLVCDTTPRQIWKMNTATEENQKKLVTLFTESFVENIVKVFSESSYFNISVLWSRLNNHSAAKLSFSLFHVHHVTCWC